MKYINILFLFLGTLLFIDCNVASPTSSRRIKKELIDYQLMTQYILCKNYHEGFNSNIIYGFEKAQETDSLLYEFMRKYKVTGIYVNKAIHLPSDDIRYGNRIEYHFANVPVVGKRSKLIFDFSSEKKNLNEESCGKGCIVVEDGVYYIEY